EPVPVRQLNPDVPRDLETVCHKCLEKDGARRYPAARELAEELGRFVAGEPVVARPVGRLERGWRWCRRNPVVAGLLLLVFLTLGAGAAVATVFAIRAEDKAQEAAQRAREAEEARQAEVRRAEEESQA